MREVESATTPVAPTAPVVAMASVALTVPVTVDMVTTFIRSVTGTGTRRLTDEEQYELIRFYGSVLDKDFVSGAHYHFGAHMPFDDRYEKAYQAQKGNRSHPVVLIGGQLNGHTYVTPWLNPVLYFPVPSPPQRMFVADPHPGAAAQPTVSKLD